MPEGAAAFAASVLITPAMLDDLVLKEARQLFRAEGLKLKQAGLVKRARVVRQPDGGVLVGIEKR